MNLSRRTTRLSLHGLGLVTVVGSLYVWVYWFYPLLGHDFAAVLPAMYEMHDAFARFGRLDVDFSPFRCLGLPVFAHPNALVWSLFHLTALVFSEIDGLLVATATFLVFGYVGCVRLVRGLGLRDDVAALMAVGWCLQGFCVAHALAGHVNYVQLCLLPLLLWVLIQRRSSWIGIGLVAFWMAHFVYTAGYYLLLVGMPSVLVAAFVLESLIPERLARHDLGGLRTAARNLLVASALAIAMCGPKILAVLDFTALFPRLVHLERIAVWKALAYTLSQYFFPFPYDTRRLTGWWYGNWESYQFILPGMVYGLAYLLYTERRELPAGRVLGLFAALVVVGTVLGSGMMAPVFEALPLFESLHVNPRWHAFVLLPFFALALGVVGALPSRRHPLPGWLLAVLGTIFFAVPLQFVDRQSMGITYEDRQGIDNARHRLSFCYEPIFGYRLEQFPVRGNVDFESDVLVDPRCYLRSSQCRPGTIFGETGTQPADRAALASYALRDEYAPVRYLKWPSLLVYLVGFACALTWLAQAVTGLIRDDVSTARRAIRGASRTRAAR